MSDNKPSKRVFYTQFSIEQYQQNAEVVKKANDTYIEGFKAVIADYNQLELDNKELERDNINLKAENEGLKKLQIVAAILQFGVLIIAGVGINRLTATPPDSTSGWVLIACAALIQLSAIAIYFLPKLGGNN